MLSVAFGATDGPDPFGGRNSGRASGRSVGCGDGCGGWCQGEVIACSLIVFPRVLLADELSRSGPKSGPKKRGAVSRAPQGASVCAVVPRCRWPRSV